MYTAHFKLTEPPFSVTPDPRYLYMSDGHREALAHLLYGIGEGGGFVQLTGEVGTGKTTLCRCLLEQLPPGVDVALILNPKLTDVELLAAVCDELRIVYPAGTPSRKLLVDALYRHLLDVHGQARRTVLILDEAQDLAPDVLEQIRLLTNLETSKQKLLQVILIGQPELIRLLDREDLRQLSQRVTARYHLLPFSADDTGAYIRHRMGVAGQKERVFTASAARQVHRASRGVPRIINAICDRALLGAYSEDDRRVGARTVRRAAREVLGRPRARRPARRWHWAVAVAAVVLAAGGALVAHERIKPTVLNLARFSQGRPAPPAPPPPPAKIESSAASQGDGGPSPLAAMAALVAAAATPDVQPARHPAPEVKPPAPPAPEVKPPAPRAGSLGELLANPAFRADKSAAFVSLYARWGLDFDVSKHILGCERGRAEGLRCLFGIGNWAKLRRIDLPAILDLGPNTSRRYGTVVALDDQTATLELGGRRFTFPLAEVAPYWDGSFILLWKAPALTGQTMEPGQRGSDVAWVRERLSEIDGSPIGEKDRDLFDSDLRARVMAFQRSRALVPDGIVGDETLVHLSFTPRDPGVPRIVNAGL